MKKAVLFILLALSFQAYSQVRVMSHNMLNFPTGNIQGRVDTLAKIIDYIKPHLLMIQELKTEQGLMDITSMMNTFGYGDFAHSDFVAQQSDPGNPYLLQQAIVYDETIFTLQSQSEILTDVRDFNEFVLYLNDANLAEGADTTFLYVYVTHLKSSTGAENQALRLAMVEDWLAYMNANRSADDNVILAGDFNLYTRNEDAFQALISDENVLPMQDIFYSYGDWTGSNFDHKEILTQSTRENQVANDGAGGGVDDRFDFILFSESMVSDANEIHYAEGSFVSLGNTGNCYNQSITDCDAGNAVPFDVLRAIYYMSDHIPQICELELNITISVPALDHQYWPVQILYGNEQISARIYSIQPTPLQWTIHDVQGRILWSDKVVLSEGNTTIEIPTSPFSDGVYLFTLEDGLGRRATMRFVIAE